MSAPFREDREDRRVLDANIAFHDAMAKFYDAQQPHYRPENVARVRHIIAGMADATGGGSLLDLGCGTGFVMDIARPLFRRVVGVDITRSMLDRVVKADGVAVCLGETSQLPVRDASFDAVTASSYLHHLYDIRATLAEAFRCLRPGGRFYADQDPNRLFWSLMTGLQGRSDLHGFVNREVEAVTKTAETAAAETNLTEEQIALAEYQKVTGGGLEAEHIVHLLREVGFREAGYHYEWFLGQGPLLHQRPAGECEIVERYLREALPATAALFKYVSFQATK